MYKAIIMKWISVLLSGLISILASITAFSQSSTVECLYEFHYVNDTTAVKMTKGGIVESGDSTKIATDRFFLDCGGSVSLFYSYDRMLADSVWKANKLAGKPSYSGYNGNVFGSNQKIYKDFTNNSLTLVDKISKDSFKVDEELPEFNWVLCDEWKEISQYKVRKATCSFRGRDYEAWYAPDIPISDGPWKFRGLPGLIFEVYDIPCFYYYCLTGIQMKEKSLEYPGQNTIKINLKKYYDTKRRYLENPVLYISSTYGGPVTAQDRDGNPINPEKLAKTLRYDFQETSFK